MNDMTATIFKSPWGDTWRVEERVGNTIFYTNHDTMSEAIKYCRLQGIENIKFE